MSVKKAISLKERKEYLISKGHKVISVDDHGFVALIRVEGSDEEIAETARLTSGSSNSKNRGLLRYLIKHKHTSPFESARMMFEIALPIFVDRQWVRHRMSGTNELSARYCELPCETWNLPNERIAYEPEGEGNNRQGSGNLFPNDLIPRISDDYFSSIGNSVETYRNLRNEKLSCEISRTVLPLSTYTRKRWWIDLHNLLHFLELRCDSHAQKEIQNYANVIKEMVREHFPITYEAFCDYRLNAVSFSAQEIKFILEMISDLTEPTKGQKINFEKLAALKINLGKTEFKEFCKKLKIEM